MTNVTTVITTVFNNEDKPILQIKRNVTTNDSLCMLLDLPFSGLEVAGCYVRPSAHADRLLVLPVSISVSFVVILNLIEFCILLLRQPPLVTVTVSDSHR
jgi:hypothetical protein